MNALRIPVDEEAEAEVVGLAVGSPTGYRLAAAVTDPRDFWIPRYGRAFASCAELADVPTTWDCAERIARAAKLADVDVDELRRLEANRSLFQDTRARFAHRVADAARRRRAMAALADAYNALGLGAGLEEAAALVDVALVEPAVDDAVGIARPWAA